jgi:putative ABC transport system ATP-binding protein
MNEKMECLIQLENISKHFVVGEQSVQALKSIQVQIARGEFVALIGPSGSGKSSMMNILGCLATPTTGSYFLNGIDVLHQNDEDLSRIRNLEIGFIFQSFHLLPRLTALKNVMQPLLLRGVGVKESQQRALKVLAQVGLADRVDHLPTQLSGGQKQRVAIARALCGEPSVLLADEPTGNLDSSSAHDIMALFKALHAQGNTIILITHDATIAQQCPRVIRLADGNIIADSSVGSLDANSDPSKQRIIDSLNNSSLADIY